MHPSDPVTHFDDSLWPLLIIRPPCLATGRQQEECLATIAAYLRRREKHLSIVDLRQVSQVPLDQRQRQVAWLQEHETLMREALIGTALIITSPVIRLSMSLILHLKPLPVPHHIGPHLATAALWAAERFQEAGLPLVAARVRQHFSAS
ncbi:hypothetical protein [Archangium sp.]|uniref:hypothetical protein n=1 Tax=Archangium sp. TaxID=1872627 RepID=UPI002D62EDD9|nr:hypothetical protein [Archangium sp.]HYO52662.1 hypothetical protein [Archangium sp.]